MNLPIEKVPVQGVFFRANVRERAQRHGLCGWVRNLHNGQVEAVLEGEEEKVKEVISLCRIGPPGARADRLDLKWEESGEGYQNFELRY